MFMRGRSQLFGTSVPSSGSRMQGPAPDGDEQVLVGALPSTTGSVGKSVHRPPGPWHGVTVTGMPPLPPTPPGLPPVPLSIDLTPAQPNPIATRNTELAATTVQESLFAECFTGSSMRLSKLRATGLRPP